MSFEMAQAQYDAMEPPDWDDEYTDEEIEEARAIAKSDDVDRRIDEARGN
jgi:hypothetical protein